MDFAGPLDCFESNAERFYQETHLMAPGKSQPMEFTATDDERQEAWVKWLLEKKFVCICGNPLDTFPL
jgi:uncharacterized protein YxeA